MEGSIPVPVQVSIALRGISMSSSHQSPPLERRLEKILTDLDQALSRAERLAGLSGEGEQLRLNLDLKDEGLDHE